MTDYSERVRRFQEQIAQMTAQPEEDQEETLAVLTFELAEERYALPLSKVREVSRTAAITPIPGLPPAVLGAMGLRGEIVPVLDLCQLLRLGQGQLTSESRLVIVQLGDIAAALLTDRVQDIGELSYAAIRPPPSGTAEAQPAFLQGIAGEGNDTTRLLDLGRLLETVHNGG